MLTFIPNPVFFDVGKKAISRTQIFNTKFQLPALGKFHNPFDYFVNNEAPKPDMAVRAMQVSDVPSFDGLTEPGGINYTQQHTQTLIDRLWDGTDKRRRVWKPSANFIAIGHRGSGMNKILTADKRSQAIMENTITSFNEAGKSGVRFVEFDVQVTRDDHAVIFHDDFIVTKEDEIIVEKRIGEVTLEEFLSYGFQKDGYKVGKPLLRKTRDGEFLNWKVSVEDSLCTLKEAFEKVDFFIGFNIELKFDDEIQYTEDQLRHILQVILEDVYQNAKGRQIFFSSFHPDAAQIVRKMQDTYPVLFLTDGGVHTYQDFRRNSLEEAVKVCITGGLQGIVTEVRAIFQDPGAIPKIKKSDLCLLTYGQLNNVPETVYIQNLIGIDGVIVDFVREISAAIEGFTGSNGKVSQSTDSQVIDSEIARESQEREPQISPPSFSPRELSFILKLIPQLMQSQ